MFKRIDRVAAWSVCAAVTAAWIGCDTSPALQEGADVLGGASAAAVSVLPGKASPGTTVRIQAARPVFAKDGLAKVKIGGQLAQILRRISDVAAEVLVPNVKPGAAVVQIIEPDRDPGTPGKLEILPAPSLQVILSFSGDGLQLIGSRPGGARSRRGIDPGGRRMQYEVFNGLGRLVFRDALTHPTLGRTEIFDEPDSGGRTMHRLGDRAAAVFGIRIPNIPGGARVRFYDVPDGVVADSPEGRRQRVFVGEVDLQDQTGPKG
ncbi:MAG: hypothetical protein ACE5E1_10365 [Phycisphaerae bacterium]